MLYLIVKHLHVTCVALSGVGFLLRGWWRMTGSPRLHHRWVKVLPHVIDSALLLSAATLCVLIGQYPLVNAWVTAKVLGLIAYIALGTLALKRGRTPAIRAASFAGALFVFVYIVSVALTKRPSGLFGMF